MISASFLFLSATVFAQETDTTDETVIELSPFEVSADGTIGYLANNTLAGTRINSKLEDIASSVQVVTQEFLDDTGATSIGQLLTYTTATEAAGVSGNASFDELNSGTARGERARREPQLNTRVRGLASADLARDYFISDIAFDPYNTSEVTINRGPNASLFGLGSPGGIINSAIDKAETDRTFGQINFKVDEFASWRASLNFNQVVLKDKLAIRVAALNSNQRYEQKQAYYDEERYFIAGTWRPMKNMIIRANYETGDGSGSRPILRPPTDRITTWFDNGKPSYNPLTQEWFVNGQLVTDSVFAAELNSSSMLYATIGANGEPIMIFDDPNSSVPGNNGYAAMQVGLRDNAAGRAEDTLPVAGHISMRMMQGPRGLFARDPNYIVGARPDIPASHRPYYVDTQLTDRSILDFRKNSLMGRTNLHSQEFEVYSFSVQNTWLDNNLGLELAYQNQYWEADLIEAHSASSAANLGVDLNLVLLDGSPNPNYGRPFIGGRGYAQARIRERESRQAIGFAKYDFADKHEGWLRHFGRHVLTGVFQQQENSETAPNRTNARASNAFTVAVARGGPGLDQAHEAGASSRVDTRTRGGIAQYLGPSLVGASSLQNSGIQGVTVPQIHQSTDNALYWNPYNAAFEPGSIEFYNAFDDPKQVWWWGNPINADEIDSISTVLQSYFLDDLIVTTVSWRSDSVKTYTGAQPNDPATGLTPAGRIPLGDPIFDETEEQTSYGVVAHMPPNWLPRGLGLSVHYVDSKNFAAGTAGNDIFNRPAPLQSGVTEEYGLSVSAFDGKLYARVNFFETSQEWVKLTGLLPHIGNTLKLVMENNTPAQLAAAGWDLYNGSLFHPDTIVALNFRPDNPNVPNNETIWTADNISGTATNYYQNTSSKGTEIELSYAPTSNWRIHLNIAEVESQISNVMPIAGPELNRIANEVFLDPQIGNLFISPNPVQNPDGSFDEDDLLRSVAPNLLSSIAIKKAPEGGPLQEIRKWRWNLLTNYNFRGSKWDDTLLSGFGVGAGLRWQDKVAIGSGLKDVDGATVPDYDNLYFGPSEINVDAWITYETEIMYDMGLQIQLRVRNLTSGNGELIPIKANPDGEVALWRIGPPRWFELSARLSF